MENESLKGSVAKRLFALRCLGGVHVTFEEKLLRFRNDLKVKRLIQQCYDTVDRLAALPRIEKELKHSFEAKKMEEKK